MADDDDDNDDVDGMEKSWQVTVFGRRQFLIGEGVGWENDTRLAIIYQMTEMSRENGLIWTAAAVIKKHNE